MFASALSDFSLRARRVRFCFVLRLAQLRTASVIKENSDSNTNS